jgi:hypothetical protein
VSVPPQPGQPYGSAPGGQPAPYGAGPAAPTPYGPPLGTQLPPGGQVPPGGPIPPGQPGAFGPPPGMPYGPPPGTPVKTSKKAVLLRALVAVVAIAVIGTIAIVSFAKSPDNAAAGDCLNVKQFKEGSEPDKVACTDPAANVKIAVKLDGSAGSCPEGDYDQYSVSGRDSYKLCLIPNDKEGDCLANFTSKTTEGYKHVTCADTTAEVKLVKIAQGVADQAGCDGTDATIYLTYSDPKSTYCYQELKQSST